MEIKPLAIMSCSGLEAGTDLALTLQGSGITNLTQEKFLKCVLIKRQGAIKKTFLISTPDSEFHLIISHDDPQYMAKAKVKLKELSKNSPPQKAKCDLSNVAL